VSVAGEGEARDGAESVRGGEPPALERGLVADASPAVCGGGPERLQEARPGGLGSCLGARAALGGGDEGGGGGEQDGEKIGAGCGVERVAEEGDLVGHAVAGAGHGEGGEVQAVEAEAGAVAG